MKIFSEFIEKKAFSSISVRILKKTENEKKIFAIT